MVVSNACFRHQDHLDFAKHLANVYLFKKVYKFISNARLKFAKNKANAKQYSEAELLLIQSYSRSSYMLSSKSNSIYSKK